MTVKNSDILTLHAGRTRAGEPNSNGGFARATSSLIKDAAANAIADIHAFVGCRYAAEIVLEAVERNASVVLHHSRQVVWVTEYAAPRNILCEPISPVARNFFKLRMEQTSNHVLQSANRAMKTGMPEETIMACLLHDTVHALIKTDHGYWGAQHYAPYV